MAGNNTYIPGLFGKSNSSEAIDKIMEARRAELTKLEDEHVDLKDEKKLWNELKEKTVSLQNISKKLYGFDAPFDQKVTLSTDERAFSANVTKAAEIGEYDVEIIKKASAHKIASKPLEKKYTIPGGEYIINVGKKKHKITFSGGTIDQFATEIRNDSKKMIRASVTWNTPTTQVLIIEAKDTGAKNSISFGNDKTKDLFRDMDFFQDIISYDKSFSITESNTKNLQSKAAPIFLEDNTLLVNQAGRYEFKLSEKIPYRENLVLDIDLKLNVYDPDAVEEKTIPTGPDFGLYGDIDIFGVTIEGESPKVTIPPYVEPPKPKVIEDDHYMEIVTDKRTIKLDELDVRPDKRTLSFDLANLLNKGETVESIILKNDNTYKTLEASNIRFYDASSVDGVRFSHEISRPDDAFLKLDGIEVSRDNNSIDDLIKGVTLYVFDKTRRTESLKIDRDYELIVGTVTDFLSEYTDYLRQLNEETSSTGGEDEEPGMFSGDFSLKSLITKLRTIMMNPYPTSYGDEIALLAQIGVSTNASGDSSIDFSKLKGILEVNENIFLEKMEEFPEGVKELFGYDSDDDYIIDTGIAFEVEKLLKAYTIKNQGVFDLRTSNYERLIERKQKDIDKFKIKLEDEEQDLKEKFYKMEKASKELEESSKKFNNLYKK